MMKVKEPLFCITLFFVFLLALKEVLNFRVDDVNKSLYFFAAFFSMLLWVVSERRIKAWRLGLAFILVLSISLFVGVGNFGSLYYFSDFFVVLAGAYFFSMISSDLRLYIFERMIFSLFIASIFGMFYTYYSGYGNINDRFPAISPYVVVMFYYFCYKKNIGILSFLSITTVLLFFVFLSGSKTSFFVAAMGAGAWFLSIKKRGASYFIIVILLLFLVLMFSEIQSIFSGSRISAFADIESNYSNLQRLYEVEDVFYHVGNSFGNNFNWLVGFGSGATFVPISSWSASNILPDGSVHHIHATPLVVLYRYGALGLLIWCLFMGYCVLCGLRSYFYQNNIFPVLIVFCIFSDQFVRNVLVNPLFFLAVSYVVYEARRKRYVA